MPDITLCTNEDCPFKDSCYRHTAKPNPIWQSYAKFEPKMEFHDRDGYSEMEYVCDNILPIVRD